MHDDDGTGCTWWPWHRRELCSDRAIESGARARGRRHCKRRRRRRGHRPRRPRQRESATSPPHGALARDYCERRRSRRRRTACLRPSNAGRLSNTPTQQLRAGEESAPPRSARASSGRAGGGGRVRVTAADAADTCVPLCVAPRTRAHQHTALPLVAVPPRPWPPAAAKARAACGARCGAAGRNANARADQNRQNQCNTHRVKSNAQIYRAAAYDVAKSGTAQSQASSTPRLLVPRAMRNQPRSPQYVPQLFRPIQYFLPSGVSPYPAIEIS